MQGGIIEIVFLAMLAGFIGLRLYHVLGRRTGHERPVGDPFRATAPELARPGPPAGAGEPQVRPRAELPAELPGDVRAGLEAIRRADRQFDLDSFLAGARAAYQTILEAFWRGDLEELAELVSDDVLADFRAAIEDRRARGETLENRLIGVDRAQVAAARMNGNMAEVTVRFDATIVAVTRNDRGEVVAGDPGARVETHDVWTFSRHVASPDPVWLLVATDVAA